MKKTIITTCAILMVSASANACGGITFKGNSGADYCLSKHTMNWYSAYAWCDGQGMKLIDLAPVCGRNIGTCSELNLSSDQKTHITDNGGTPRGWTNTSGDNVRAWSVNLDNGGIHLINNSGGRSYQLDYALCK